MRFFTDCKTRPFSSSASSSKPSSSSSLSSKENGDTNGHSPSPFPLSGECRCGPSNIVCHYLLKALQYLKKDLHRDVSLVKTSQEVQCKTTHAASVQGRMSIFCWFLLSPACTEVMFCSGGGYIRGWGVKPRVKEGWGGYSAFGDIWLEATQCLPNSVW